MVPTVVPIVWSNGIVVEVTASTAASTTITNYSYTVERDLIAQLYYF